MVNHPVIYRGALNGFGHLGVRVNCVTYARDAWYFYTREYYSLPPIASPRSLATRADRTSAADSGLMTRPEILSAFDGVHEATVLTRNRVRVHTCGLGRLTLRARPGWGDRPTRVSCSGSPCSGRGRRR